MLNLFYWDLAGAAGNCEKVIPREGLNEMFFIPNNKKGTVTFFELKIKRVKIFFTGYKNEGLLLVELRGRNHS